MKIDTYIPDAKLDLERFYKMLFERVSFTFIRFSDGEMEIIRNRYVEIGNGYTVFKNKKVPSNFPEYDRKVFDPEKNILFREELLNSARKSGLNYFKGIPSTHNNLIDDRDFMVSLNSGMSKFMTFSDLLLNSNYLAFRKKIVPLFSSIKNLAVIANYRAKFQSELSHANHICIGDNIFENYKSILDSVMLNLNELPNSSVVLSSASSLSNILGMKLYEIRPDITFIDIGTSLNDLLGLDSRTRAYHNLYFSKSIKEKIIAFRYTFTKEYKIKW